MLGSDAVVEWGSGVMESCRGKRITVPHCVGVHPCEDGLCERNRVFESDGELIIN